MSKVIFSIQYAGMTLQIGKNERGEDVTPLKPISDLFGLQWERQRKKVSSGGYLSKFLGVCTMQLHGADGQKREQTCILLSRVAAYMMGINPDQVHAVGNVDGANFLMEKLDEWADALHDFEEIGVAINLNHAKAQEALRKQRVSLVQTLGTMNKTADPQIRRAIGGVASAMASDLGVLFQLELPEGGAQ